MRIINLLVVISLLSIFQSASAKGKFGVDAYQASEIICNVNNRYKSTFRFQPNGQQWKEYTADNQQFNWRQSHRDEWSIYLNDQARGYQMQLDLHTTKVTYGFIGQNQKHHLCTIVSAKSNAVRSSPVAPSLPQHSGQYCAKENQVCRFNGMAKVYYGADNRWTNKRLRGPVQCNNQTFGDPARGTPKTCRYKLESSSPTRPRQDSSQPGQYCARENQRCQFNGMAIVYYGADSRWTNKRLRGPIQCNNGTFGDPARGTAKTCRYQLLSSQNNSPSQASNVNEAQYDIKQVTLNGMGSYATDRLVKWVIRESLRQEQPMCWKKSLGNTVGKPLSSCPAGKKKSAGLCYSKCRKGYKSDGLTLCYKKCPKGTSTSPGFCHYSFGSIGGCPGKLSGLKPACINDNSYSRGIGKPMTCKSNQVQKGALCYPSCPSGYSHGGPVCWQQCSGAHPVDCGAGCAKSTGQCVAEVANMVLATGELVANIAGVVLTGGAANAGMKTAKTAVRTGQKVAARIALKKILQSARKTLANKLRGRLGARVLAHAAKKSGRRQSAKLAQDYTTMVLKRAAQKIIISQMSNEPSLREVLSMIDPTGVVDVINAYDKPLCVANPMP